MIVMSRRRSRSRQPASSEIGDDQIVELVSQLQQLLPELRHRRHNKVLPSLYLSKPPFSAIDSFAIRKQIKEKKRN